MRHKLSAILFKLLPLLREDGQDLVEYALIISLLAFAVLAAVNSPGVQLNSALTAISQAIGRSVN